MTETAPSNLHLPQFTYAEPANVSPVPPGFQPQSEDTHSQGFNFSALFQSTVASSSPGLSVLLSRSSQPPRASDEDNITSFIGFSWGPALDAFPAQESHRISTSTLDSNTPRPIRLPSTYLTPNTNFVSPPWPIQTDAIPNRYTTPMRPTALTPFQTLQRTGTARPSTLRRSVSDREAMKQLVDCVGMSARKIVLQSGRKPRILRSFSSSGSLKLKKDLGFVIPLQDYGNTSSTSYTTSSGDTGTLMTGATSQFTSALLQGRPKENDNEIQVSGSEDTTDTEGPPSPSPTPRPSSSMSILSTRRAGTPTIGSMRIVSQGSTITMSLGVPRSASVRSMRSSSLSFNRSFGGETSPGLLPHQESDTDKARGVPTMGELEKRLERLMADMRSLEEKLGRLRQMAK